MKIHFTALPRNPGKNTGLNLVDPSRGSMRIILFIRDKKISTAICLQTVPIKNKLTKLENFGKVWEHLKLVFNYVGLNERQRILASICRKEHLINI